MFSCRIRGNPSMLLRFPSLNELIMEVKDQLHTAFGYDIRQSLIGSTRQAASQFNLLAKLLCGSFCVDRGTASPSRQSLAFFIEDTRCPMPPPRI